MEENKSLCKLIKEKQYAEAVEIFDKTPILDYKTENPKFKFKMFEYSLVEIKNLVFLRVLLNYISLLNIINTHATNPEEFHQILFYFSAKFTYEELENGYHKIILMAKSTIDIYNAIFQQGEKVFENVESDVKSSIDLSFFNKDQESLGYTFQELGKVFINDYIIGRNKGKELPNILFYVKSTKETENLVNELFFPTELKLDFNEKYKQSGVNEFDNIVLLNDDITIDQNNPYFRYIKAFKNNNANYDKLDLKKNELYIFEFKHSYTMNDNIVKIENKGNSYLKLYNKNRYNINNSFNIQNYTILYCYNYFENLGYRNFSGYNINLDKWKFLYLNPSCQIIPVAKLSSEVSILKKKVKILEEKNKSIEEKNKSIEERLIYLEKLLIQKRYDGILKEKKIEEFTVNKDLKFKIEEQFRELSSEITKVDDIIQYNKLIKYYEAEIQNFTNNEEMNEIADINPKDEKWKVAFKGQIKDDKTFLQLLIPNIGYKKASNNFFLIQDYLAKKMNRNDEMSEIYQYIYYCFFGRRKLNDKKSPEKFFKESDQVHIDILKNVLKFTFYFDKTRKGKEYFLLALFKEILKIKNVYYRKCIFELRNKSLYQLVLIAIDLLNLDNKAFFKDYFNNPTKVYI